MSLIESITPILFSLLFGYTLGNIFPRYWSERFNFIIIPLVWLLLFIIGIEFGSFITSLNLIKNIVKQALLFSLLITISICICLKIIDNLSSLYKHEIKKNFYFKFITFYNIYRVVRETSIALLMIITGGIYYLISKKFYFLYINFPPSGIILFFLIIFVGIDLSQFSLKESHFSFKFFLVPFFVIICSLIGGSIVSYITDEPIFISLALSSGYGWFTLSSMIIGKYLGENYGTLSLIIDLFREILSIIILYSFGSKYPIMCIGNAGSTSMDSTLPIIRQVCSFNVIPIALINGLILSFISPILILFFL